MKLLTRSLSVMLVATLAQQATAQVQTASEAAKTGVVPATNQSATIGRNALRVGPQQSQALNFYSDRPTFQAANPGLPLENYQNGNIGNGGVSGCESPIDEFSNDACWSPGDILPGISLEFIDNGGDPNDPNRMAILWNLAGIDCAGVGANYFVDYNRYNFNPPVKGAGMLLEMFSDVVLTVDIEVFDGNGASLGVTQVTSASQFFGVDTDDPNGIGSIEFIDFANGGVFFCDVEFGGTPGGGGGCTDKSLSTFFNGTNSGGVGWMTLMDLDVVNPNGIDVTAFDINDNNAGVAGGPIEIDIWTTSGGLAGKELDINQWNMVATGAAVANAEGTPTFVDTGDFNLAPGLWGIAIHYRVGSGPAYTNGNGTNEVHVNADTDLIGCCSVTGLFTGSIFSPRIFNGTVYSCSPAYEGRTYCTAKTNSCGTIPSISGTGIPSASQSSGFVIAASNARANRIGLLGFSNQGRAATPFDGGLLCTASPFSTSPPVSFSGGTSMCDGEFSVDMNAYATSGLGPAYLSVPGTDVTAQWIGRDTQSHGAYLSDGLNYCVGL